MRPFNNIYDPDDLLHGLLLDTCRYVAYRIINFFEYLIGSIVIAGVSAYITLWVTGGLP